jgi:hypothetical protein
MFFNPFSGWYILFVIIPFRLLSFITYLPCYPLSLIGVGKFYKKGHYFVWEHIQQFALQPKNYCKHVKKINKQIIEDAKEFL